MASRLRYLISMSDMLYYLNLAVCLMPDICEKCNPWNRQKMHKSIINLEKMYTLWQVFCAWKVVKLLNKILIKSNIANLELETGKEISEINSPLKPFYYLANKLIKNQNRNFWYSFTAFGRKQRFYWKKGFHQIDQAICCLFCIV